MKFSTFLILLSSILISSTSFATEQSSKIQISIVNSSLNQKYIQVKDEVCTKTLSSECEFAEIILKSSECKKNRKAENCAGAQEIADDAACVEEIVFFGLIDRDETITVDICTSYTGKGQIAIRNSSTAPWVHYKWVEAGDTINPSY